SADATASLGVLPVQAGSAKPNAFALESPAGPAGLAHGVGIDGTSPQGYSSSDRQTFRGGSSCLGHQRTPGLHSSQTPDAGSLPHSPGPDEHARRSHRNVPQTNGDHAGAIKRSPTIDESSTATRVVAAHR